MRSPSCPARALASCRRPPVKRRNLILILASTAALSALALTAARARDVPKVATSFVANVVCTETFASGLDPARVYAETMSAMPGTGLIAWALDYRVDRARKDVTGDAVRPRPKSRRLPRRRPWLLSRSWRGGRRHSRCRYQMQRPRCCLTSPVLPSSRRKRRNWLRRSTTPLPSPTHRRRAIPARSSS